LFGLIVTKCGVDSVFTRGFCYPELISRMLFSSRLKTGIYTLPTYRDSK